MPQAAEQRPIDMEHDFLQVAGHWPARGTGRKSGVLCKAIAWLNSIKMEQFRKISCQYLYVWLGRLVNDGRCSLPIGKNVIRTNFSWHLVFHFVMLWFVRQWISSALLPAHLAVFKARLEYSGMGGHSWLEYRKWWILWESDQKNGVWELIWTAIRALRILDVTNRPNCISFVSLEVPNDDQEISHMYFHGSAFCFVYLYLYTIYNFTYRCVIIILFSILSSYFKASSDTQNFDSEVQYVFLKKFQYNFNIESTVQRQ